ncbi:MAG: amidohydrolase family protein [Candidatus Sulfobium sp.]
MTVSPEESGPDLLRIPPFRDAHMHFMTEGGPVTAEELPEIRDRYRKCGIFSVYDMGHKSGIGLKAKELFGGFFSLETAGWSLYREGGYGGFTGKAVSGNNEIKKAVGELSGAGVDFIKVINSGIVSTRRDEPVTAGGFPLEELKVVCQEAGGRGLQVHCHANSDESVRNAVLAGVSAIEHGFLISRETVHMMAGAGVSWTPTVIGLRNILRFLNADEQRYMEEVLGRHLIAISEASTAGVTLKTGTDGGARGVPHGGSFFEELLEFHKAGLSPEKILTAACMPREEMDKGNYLLVRKDFITAGEIQAVYEDGIRLVF